MRFILDTNQVSQLDRHGPTNGTPRGQIEVVLSSFVHYEFLVSEHRERYTEALLQYGVRFGMNESAVALSMSKRPPDQVRLFDPVHSVCDDEHLCRHAELRAPSAQKIEAAKTVREINAIFSRRLQADSDQLKAEYKEVLAKGDRNKVPQIASLQQMEAMLRADTPRLHSLVKRDLGALWLPDAEMTNLLDAILAHPIYWRYVLYANCLVASHARRFADRELNKSQIAETRNDCTDNYLALFARDCDVVVSSDRAVKRFFQFISGGVIPVLTWEECMAAYFAPRDNAAW